MRHFDYCPSRADAIGNHTDFEFDALSYPVPREVGKVGTQSPDYLKPVSERKGNIASFFAKQPLKKEDKKDEKSPSQNKGVSSKKAVLDDDDAQSKAFAEEVHEDEKESAAKIGAKGRHHQDTGHLHSDKSDISSVDDEAADLPLNPDEGDDIASQIERIPHASGKQRRISKVKSPSDDEKGKQRTIVLDDTGSEAGDTKAAAIVLSDVDSGSDADGRKRSTRSKDGKTKGKTTQQSSKGNPASVKGKRVSEDDEATETFVKERKSKKTGVIKGPTSIRAKHAPEDEAITDHQGNATLENFFEIKDD